MAALVASITKKECKEISVFDSPDCNGEDRHTICVGDNKIPVTDNFSVEMIGVFDGHGVVKLQNFSGGIRVIFSHSVSALLNQQSCIGISSSSTIWNLYDKHYSQSFPTPLSKESLIVSNLSRITWILFKCKYANISRV